MPRIPASWQRPWIPLLLVVTCTATAAATGPDLKTHLRRPVVLLVQGPFVVSGNRDSGTVSVIDRVSGVIRGEYSVARRIADLAPIAGGQAFLLLDDGDACLRRVSLDDATCSAETVAEVPASSVKLVVATAQPRVFITSKWSHRVVVQTFDHEFTQLQQSKSIALPFAPQELVLVDDERRLLVADAFGGQLAVVDAQEGKLLGIRKLLGHNIRGLAVSSDGQRLHVAHQQMDHRARADYEDLHWGQMLTNAVQVFAVSDVLERNSGHLTGGWMDTQGGIGSGTGDPAGVVTGPNELRVVALSGIGAISIRQAGRIKRLSVQTRPEAMVVVHDRLFVANRLDDSISIVDLQSNEVIQTISLGPAPQLTAVQRGERLFFDARLSHDGWISCHSCHTDGHTSGLLVDTLGDGNYGAPKQTPSLLGTHGTQPWAWDGSMQTLRAQVDRSVTSTMHGHALTAEQTSDLVAYLESLAPPPPVQHISVEQLRSGQAVFAGRGCVECHTPPTFTSSGTFDVGLSDEHGRTAFNPPSLRGVGQRVRLFHDGRAGSLEEVLQHERHQLTELLSDSESAALLHFLRSL